MITITEITLTLEDLSRLSAWRFKEAWEAIGEAAYLKARASEAEQEADRPAASRPGITGGLPSEGAPSAVSPEGYELGAGQAEFLHGVGHGPLDEPEPEPPVTSETIAPEPSEPYPFACDRCGHEAAGPKSLESHEATCRVPFGSFVCPFCQRSDFGTPQALGAHKRYKHAQGVAA